MINKEADLGREEFFIAQVASGKLKVTRSGHVFNTETGRELGATIPPKGRYRMVSGWCTETKTKKQISLHRLVWAVFKGIPKDDTLLVMHKDDDRQNCSIKNLKLGTNSENVQAAFDTGATIPCRGTKKGKLTAKQVLALCKLYQRGGISYENAGAKFGIATMTAYDIIKGKSYTDVPRPGVILNASRREQNGNQI